MIVGFAATMKSPLSLYDIIARREEEFEEPWQMTWMMAASLAALAACLARLCFAALSTRHQQKLATSNVDGISQQAAVTATPEAGFKCCRTRI